MPRLILLRHAKAAHPGGSDLERPLAPKGQEQCRVVAPLLAGWLPAAAEVVVSPAKRTRQTWQQLSELLPTAPSAASDERIYEAVPGALLELVQEQTTEALVLVGHSPGIPRLAYLLCADPAPAVESFLRVFPTSGCVVLEAAEPFALWQPGCAEVLAVFSGDISPVG